MIIKVVLSLLVITSAVVLFRFYSLGQQSLRMSPELGLENGQLKACGEKPNCVSSSSRGEHKIEAISYTGSFETIRDQIKAMSLGELKLESERYLHYTVASSLFKFADDVEFYFPEDKSVIEVRSASRVGHSDMGVNRKRIEKIRQKLSTTE